MNTNRLNKVVYSYSVLTIFWAALLITLPSNTNASVSPPRVKIEAKPREKITFNLEVKNKHDTPRTYQINYSYYAQDKDGYQEEIKLEDKSQEGPWNWIKLDSGETFNIDGKKSLPIKGVIKIPSRNSHGFHNILITVTELTPRKKTGVTLNYASGSLIELTVTGSKKRPKTAILNPMIKMDQESGVSAVYLDFDNQSAYKGRLFLEGHIRLNKRLVAKTTLLTDKSQKSGLIYSSVFPNNQVHLMGELDKKLAPGDYEIRILGNFNGAKLRSFSQKLTIDESGNSIIEDDINKQASSTLNSNLKQP